MQFNFLLNHKLPILLGAFWLVLFFTGLFSYQGTVFVYVLFSMLFLLMLLSGIYRQVSYGYLFLVVFLWLGFWFKLTASYLLSGGKAFVFEESIGSFNGSLSAWDEVLWVAICASLGVILGRFIYGFFGPKSCYDNTRVRAPAWYPSVRIWLWAIVMLAAAGVAIFNVAYGIHQIGMVPKTILPWPLNALIAWMLNIGFALAIAVLIWWDMAAKKGVAVQLCAMLAEGFASSASVISRSMFVFHVVPQLFVFSRRNEVLRAYSTRTIILFFIAFMTLLLSSIAVVSIVRDFQYAVSQPVSLAETPIITSELSEEKNPKPNKPEDITTSEEAASNVPSSFRLRLIHQLLVNRWVGMEGVMAVSSYQIKEPALLWEMLVEKREAGKVSAYQRISNSSYQRADANHQFATLPGAAAFFFYSGSFVVVILCMAILILLMLVLEKGLFVLTKNPLFCSLFGMTAANTIAQFGVTPRQDIPYFLMIILSALFICIVQFRDMKASRHSV